MIFLCTFTQRNNVTYPPVLVRADYASVARETAQNFYGIYHRPNSACEVEPSTATGAKVVGLEPTEEVSYPTHIAKARECARAFFAGERDQLPLDYLELRVDGE